MLTKVTETYTVDTEQEAMDMLEDAKNKKKNEQMSKGYVLQKSGYSVKQKKQKGEIVDEYFIVNLTKTF